MGAKNLWNMNQFINDISIAKFGTITLRNAPQNAVWRFSRAWLEGCLDPAPNSNEVRELKIFVEGLEVDDHGFSMFASRICLTKPRVRSSQRQLLAVELAPSQDARSRLSGSRRCADAIAVSNAVARPSRRGDQVGPFLTPGLRSLASTDASASANLSHPRHRRAPHRPLRPCLAGRGSATKPSRCRTAAGSKPSTGAALHEPRAARYRRLSIGNRS